MISLRLFNARRAPQGTWIAAAILGAAACGGGAPAGETGSGSETSGGTTVEASTSDTTGTSGAADPTTSSTATTSEPTTTSATTAETTETTSAASTDPSTGTGTSTTGDLPACVLGESGPIVVEADDQVIENLHIVSTRGPAITVEGHAGVTIRNVWIEHAGGPGIAIGGGSDDIHIENVAIEHTGAPAEGQNPSDGLNNIECYGSARPVVTGARLVRGSSGIYLVECPDAELSFLEGHDFRGPFPRGQLVQFDKSNGGVLEDFSVINPQASSWPEDNVNIYQSVDVEIRRGMIDGNNSPSGVGVIFDGDLALGVVEDVDAIRMGNGCFSDYAGSDGVVFRRTRCRENICEDQGRGAPLSNALMWAGHPGYTKIRLEDSHYFASCNGNLVWPDESFEVIELDELDFTMREPIVVPLCWE
ncbi:hypothetical protein OV203_05130 [Nannocystis sp. ILAH1]|uniref:hypothetical protein n=1 Tax=Nannocystis sp. ILAH1 TaxID=2996789 RepID=UPI0022700E5E|nr:hypothetical protein [Nannocystis sp. ILAH1]MCY0986489.1 hypothetical protein [Nannocystis sp. ILAH1]